MQSDVFRFIALRQPVKAALGDDAVIETSSESDPTELLRTLEAARNSGAKRIALSAAAINYLNSGEFVRSLSEAAPELTEIERRIAEARGALDAASIREGITHVNLAALSRRLSDSLLASLLAPSGEPSDRVGLERGLRVLSILRHTVQEPEARREALRRLYLRPLSLPPTIFPLASNNEKAESGSASGFETQRKAYAAYQTLVSELGDRLHRNETAVAELLQAYRDDSVAKQRAADSVSVQPQDRSPSSNGFTARVLRRLGLARGRAAEDPSQTRTGPFVPTLSAEIAGKISASTRERLAAVGRTADALNVPDSVSALDNDSARIARQLYRGGAFGNAVRVGKTFVNAGDLFGFPTGHLATADPGPRPIRTPGICALREPEPPALDTRSVPEGAGKCHSLGVVDLLVVRQRLLRYELGEVAHVENVMAKESRKRHHRNLHRREEFHLQETERIEENEKDLQSTERFELQNESERTIQESANRQAGVTVTSSYGASVEVTANAAFSSDTAKSQSDRIAASHAREITERSVQRIQERVHELRSTLTVSETEEINEHGFSNETNEHVIGVYRWLDKIYQAQVFDYGKREILEVVVPEPAAFLRYAVANNPPEGATLARPDPPGYCVAQQSTFVPLEPKDITRTSYLFWTARYNSRNVTPPPPRFRIIATAFDQPWTTDEPTATATSNKEVKVPDGYQARKAWSAGNHAHYAQDPADTRQPQLRIYVGRHELNAQSTVDLNGENEVVPIAIIGILLLVYAATVEVECELTEEAFAQWQIDTYAAIMSTYEEQRAAYEEQIRSAQNVFEDVTAPGRNPAQNRNIERTELKKAVISQMTGQQFDLFDAMRRNVKPHGFPQSDLNEAFAEGEYIRFVEQAFEWENMLYLFYPYFWGRKDQWPLMSQMDDPDPVFAEFLKAGAARVNVPIRPGFEKAVNSFLSTGLLPWKSDDGAVITMREPFLSITEEMKNQQGAIHTKSGGTINVTASSREIAGVETDFNEDDQNREITIRGEVYRIKSVASATELTLTTAYRGDTAAEVGYVIGAKAVGEPWTLRLPTSLVILQDDHALPEFAAEE